METNQQSVSGTLPILSFTEAVGYGWRQFKGNALRHIGTALMVVVVMFGASIAVSIIGSILKMSGAPVQGIQSLADTVVSLWIFTGVSALYLTISRTGVHTYSLLWKAPRQWEGFLGQIVMRLLTIVGMLLLLIPGIVWSIRYFFMPLLVLDRGMGIKEAMAHSARMTYGYKVRLVGYGIGFGAIMLLGILALGVGALVAIPVVALGYVHLYEKCLAIAAMRTDQVPVGNIDLIYKGALYVGVPIIVLSALFTSPSSSIDLNSIRDINAQIEHMTR
jgi:hypothetical protein